MVSNDRFSALEQLVKDVALSNSSEVNTVVNSLRRELENFKSERELGILTDAFFTSLHKSSGADDA